MQSDIIKGNKQHFGRWGTKCCFLVAKQCGRIIRRIFLLDATFMKALPSNHMKPYGI